MRDIEDLEQTIFNVAKLMKESQAIYLDSMARSLIRIEEILKKILKPTMEAYLKVLEIEPQSQAEKAMMQIKDIIFSYNGKLFYSEDSLTEFSLQTPVETHVVLKILRDSKTHYIEMHGGKIGIKCEFNKIPE